MASSSSDSESEAGPPWRRPDEDGDEESASVSLATPYEIRGILLLLKKLNEFNAHIYDCFERCR
jgi:hypothetical protein